MRRVSRILPLALGLALAPGLPSCNDHAGLLVAKKIAHRSELIGGPVAMADVGDFLLQNDKIRVTVLRAMDSPAPGVFGGSIIDADLRRDRLDDKDGNGRDRFAELFPVANLLVPNPEPGESSVRVLSDGSDGKEASIRVEGKGAFLFEALALLQTQKNLLSFIFPDIKTAFRFRTDYIVRPGERSVLIRTALLLDDQKLDCPDASACDPAACEFGFKGDARGCPLVTCECGTPAPLAVTTEPTSVFGTIFGDPQSAPNPVHRAGVLAGDFVFFGNQNDVFAPGIGYDEERAVNEAFYAGKNTFQSPLAFDFVAASGGDVSYGYFTVGAPGTSPVVNVPIITSAATAFLAAAKSCLFDTSDDVGCDDQRAFTYERRFVIGSGDIGSIADEVWRARGTPTGRLKGSIHWEQDGEGVGNAQVFVFANPKPGHGFASVDELVEENLKKRGDVGLLDVIDADLGVDPVEDGDFDATIPPGDYAIVARTKSGSTIGKPFPVSVRMGETVVISPRLPTPTTIQYRVVGEDGQPIPAKIAAVALDDDDKPLDRDGRRRVFMGDGRLGNSVREIEHSATGSGSFRLEPGGRYLLRASRGPEYGIFESAPFTAEPGRAVRFDAIIGREIDTVGWMSADMHLHAQPSFDSGMPLDLRVRTVADEHVELAIPTDHDVETDYLPPIREQFLEPFVATAVSAETTTIEQGHFIAFPLRYDATIVPTRGSHDPTCQSGGEILDALRSISASPEIKPFTIVAHPRDGFFGYVDQLGVDTFTMLRELSTLEENNPVFRTASCDFDAMEIINGKRFDLVRTATIQDVVDYNRCRARLDKAKNEADLAAACPEIKSGLFAPCKPGERFAVCQHRNRSALVWESMKRILVRTPEEQDAHWDYDKTMADSQAACEVGQYGDTPLPDGVKLAPCAQRVGHVDDYFRYLERGMLKTHIASSDSHGGTHEPGFPRTYFRSSTDAPGGLDIKDAVDSLRGEHAFATYGPFIRADVSDKTFGETASAAQGAQIKLNLRVETASWFGVDRIEIYMNGRLVRVETPTSKPQDTIDFNGAIPLTVPNRDSWIVVIAMGLNDANLMSKVSVDVPFGEIQISRVVSDAFSLVPVVNTLFAPVPILPDWYPIPAYAVTNPIYLDTDGNGKYDAPLPPPEFCSVPCQIGGPNTCPQGQSCLDPEGVCGVFVSATCDYRVPWSHGG